MKNKKGVTLISLVVTIIVLGILISVATFSGISVLQSSKLTAFTTKMKIMQAQVNELYNRYINDEPITVGGTEYVGKNEEGKSIIEIGKEKDNKHTELLSNTLHYNNGNDYNYWNNEIINQLEIEGIDEKDEFLVNIQNRSVVSCSGFKYQGEIYYRLDDLPDSLYNVPYDAPQSEKPKFKCTPNGKRVTISEISYNRIY